MLARRLSILLLVALAVFAGCRKKASIPPEVIVRVGERMVSLTDFKRYLERNAGSELAQVTPEVASAMLDQYVEEIILSEYAFSHGIEVPAEAIAAEVRTEPGATVIEKRDEMRREKLIASISAEIPEADPATVNAYYQAHVSEFGSPEEVRVRQILVNDGKVAAEVVRKLKSGQPFEELSAEYSRAPNARRGGEIGFVARTDLPKMFADEIFGLSAGEVSQVIQTDSSFHIFKVEERRPAGTLDLVAATPLIVVRLKEEAVRERLSVLVAENRKSIGVAVLTRRLPFQYSGSLPKAQTE